MFVCTSGRESAREENYELFSLLAIKMKARTAVVGEGGELPATSIYETPDQSSERGREGGLENYIGRR